MELRLQLLAVIASGALLLGVLELVRRRRFLERYAIFWLFAALVLLVLSIWKGLLGTVAHAFGIFYAPNALFVVALGFVLLLLLHFSLAVSRLADQAKVMAQRLALLEERLRSHEQATVADADSEDEPESEHESRVGARFR